MSAKLLRSGDDSVCLIGIGKLLGACLEAADELEAAGVDATVWDPRLVCPADPAMLRDALGHGLVSPPRTASAWVGPACSSSMR